MTNKPPMTDAELKRRQYEISQHFHKRIVATTNALALRNIERELMEAHRNLWAEYFEGRTSHKPKTH